MRTIGVRLSRSSSLYDVLQHIRYVLSDMSPFGGPMNSRSRLRFFCCAILISTFSFASPTAWALGAKRPEKPAPRVLKKIVELGLIDAKPIMSQSGSFDFQEAINRQFSAVAAGKFVVRKAAQPI